MCARPLSTLLTYVEALPSSPLPFLPPSSPSQEKARVMTSLMGESEKPLKQLNWCFKWALRPLYIIPPGMFFHMYNPYVTVCIMFVVAFAYTAANVAFAGDWSLFIFPPFVCHPHSWHHRFFLAACRCFCHRISFDFVCSCHYEDVPSPDNGYPEDG